MTDRTMRAKMYVASISKSHNDATDPAKVTGVALQLGGVSKSGPYNPDGSGDEDNSFARWSPSVSLTIQIQNPALFDSFHYGQKFYVDFTEAPDSPKAPDTVAHQSV